VIALIYCLAFFCGTLVGGWAAGAPFKVAVWIGLGQIAAVLGYAFLQSLTRSKGTS
jgi:hypothetical protein